MAIKSFIIPGPQKHFSTPGLTKKTFATGFTCFSSMGRESLDGFLSAIFYLISAALHQNYAPNKGI
jgi:hypothetical protein